MLNIHINFESSLTNQLLNEHKEPLFTSSSGFKDGLRKLNKTNLDAAAPVHQTLVHHIRQMNAANPEMTYRVPASYDNTVLGILARICGEIRRVSDLEPLHPLHAIWSNTSYQMHVSSEHSEVYALATPPNAIQTSGAGLVPAGNPFYTNSDIAHQVFGHLSLPLSDQLQARPLKGTWYPKTPFDLINRLEVLKTQLEEQTKEQRKFMGAGYISPVEPFAKWFKEALLSANITIATKEVDFWNVAGARLVLNILQLPLETRTDLIEKGFLSRNGNLQGIAMSGHIGNVTPKDVYVGAGCKKAISTSMPYQTDLWFEHLGKNVKFAVGVIKKSGTLHIKIDDAEEDAIRERIINCAVGPFQFGKKGLAYVNRLYIS